MVKVLAVGGFEKDDVDFEKIELFTIEFAKFLVNRGHTLIGGAQTEFDKLIAENTWKALKESDPENAENRLISYVRNGAEPNHEFGRLRESQLQSWDPGQGLPKVPEPVERADVVVLVRGFDSTFRAYHWADVSNKPVLPVAYFGGASKEIYRRELDKFDEKYGRRIDKDNYEDLSDVGRDISRRAERVVELCEDIAVSRTVMCAMAYMPEGPEKTELANLYDSFEIVCKPFGYSRESVTELTVEESIVPEILQGIEHAGFLIVDLTHLRQNVFYEFGFAMGMKKQIIATAKEGTELPFDVLHFPVIFWDPSDLRTFREKLKVKVEKIVTAMGWAEEF